MVRSDDVDLEVISRGRTSASHPAPVLFVHGAWHAAWCWSEHFLDYFADRGYHALALSLRGYGNSVPASGSRRCSVADYVADVRVVAERLPAPPVVIGHSLGGFIVQKYLEHHHAPAAVLVASAPVRGVAACWMRWLRRHPLSTTGVLMTGRSLRNVSSIARARETFFSPATPGEHVARYVGLLEVEQARKAVLDMMMLDLPRPDRVRTPMLVLGAEHDGAFTTAEVHATARAYRTQAQIFPGMGHDMMLEPGWDLVANRIDRWLSSRAL